ncbi:MAG TPA: UvrD-helicase domain-containing protein [Gammaproteobacteria bacterium]|nr:UvrD-helicase domain-containing protein [Gammaproteobacteria bacterium]
MTRPLSPSLHQLNPAQRAAVTHLEGPLLVLAGAGSGKTRVIVRKIAYLLGERGFAATELAALTFTNKAAREMKSRVAELLPAERLEGLTVATFHTLGMRLLREEHARLGYKRGFTLFDAEDSLTLLRELLKVERAEKAEVLERAQWCISAWKSALVDADTAAAQAADEFGRRTARLYRDYERHLQAYNAMDFDDLIARPVRLLESDAEARGKWQARLRYLLVDEYQDTNAAQYRLLRVLAGPQAPLTAVGDDDQSIYSWRGAQPQNLALLKQDYPALKVVKLEQNYRSTRRILRVANGLIGHNPHLFEKRLWSELAEGEPVRVLPCADAAREAEQVVAEIASLKLTQQRRYGDFAVLYRSNHQSRLFEKTLREHRIPYSLSGGTSFFDRAEVRDLVAYLRLLVNPEDDSAFLRIVNLPRRELGAATLERLGSYAGARHLSLFSACFAPDLAAEIPERGAERLRAFAVWVSKTAERAEREPAAEVVKAMLDDIGYRTWLEDSARDAATAERKWENVQEFVGWLARPAGGTAGLADSLAQLALMDMLDRNEGETDGDAVQLSTLHAAKGLEFPHVYLVGVEEESLPHRNSLEGEALEEERRLCYVGITRAQRTLTLSYADQRKKYGEAVACEPSRFLKELPRDDLQFEGEAEPADAEGRAARGRERLDSLRGLLSES